MGDRQSAGAPWPDPQAELEELRAYLGHDFDPRGILEWEGLVDRELERRGVDEAEFYRSSTAYLYNLTAFAMTGTKVPYLRELMRWVPPPARLLDFGCGIGSDGLLLIEAGYDVAFADFDNPSIRYLRWRLNRRGREAAIFDLDRERPPHGFDAVYAFDVLEHVPSAEATLEDLERLASLVCVNLLESGPSETALHAELPVSRLLRGIARRQLVAYRRPYPRSHLVLYRPQPGAFPTRVRAAALRATRRVFPGRHRTPSSYERRVSRLGRALTEEARSRD